MAFSDRERNLLLATPGIGPGVILRLEQAGLDSLVKLRSLGVELAVETVCNKLGSSAWANRRRPLQRVLSK